jgi:hypothetical protein
MHKHLLVAAIATAALTSIAAVAKDAAPPAPMAMPAELAQLDFFVGTWQCSGKTFANPMGPAHATTASVHAARTVGGRWLHLTYDENKTAANPTPYHAGVYMGYDGAQKKFVQYCLDVAGGHCTQSSAGWNGDSLVFEGTSRGDGGESGARDTFTKKGSNEVTHTGEMQGADQKWMKLDEETCHKGK